MIPRHPSQSESPPITVVPAWVALGANLGDARLTLHRALAALASTAGIALDAVSPLIITDPIGPAQPRYHNAVARILTTLPPHRLLQALLAIETSFHRHRSHRWGPRTLDLDLLLHGPAGAMVCNLPDLTLPHPYLHLRTFVLQPLLAIDPGLVHPRTSIALAASLEALFSNGPLL